MVYKVCGIIQWPSTNDTSLILFHNMQPEKAAHGAVVFTAGHIYGDNEATLEHTLPGGSRPNDSQPVP